MSERIIKSITVKKNCKFAGIDLSKITLEDLSKDYPDAFEIEYKKQDAKYPNGAEVFAPEKGVRIFYPYDTKDTVIIALWDGCYSELVLLNNQSIFLDKTRCELATKLEQRHYEITKKVYEINAENNWVADWSDENQNKYYCYFYHRNNQIDFSCTSSLQSSGEAYFCHQAQEYLETLSTEDQKAFLLIYT